MISPLKGPLNKSGPDPFNRYPPLYVGLLIKAANGPYASI